MSWLSHIPQTIAKPTRIPTKNYDPSLPLCAVILTVHNGSSYDELFRAVQQEPPADGVAISCWNLRYEHLPDLEMLMREGGRCEVGREWEAELIEVVSDLSRAEPQSVLLNFECCSGCSDSGFPAGCSPVSLIRLFLDRQHVVNTGDFSTKALIAAWDPSLLGPNPFVRVGDFSSGFSLNFNPEVLKACPSAQLVRVGEMCAEKGSARVRALAGTCMFSVDFARTETDEYELQVLTVMTATDTAPVGDKECRCSFGGEDHRGSAGHVLMRYRGKGLLTLSAGHWIELSRLDTDVHYVQKQFEMQYGESAAKEFMANYSSQAPAMQECFLQANASMFVQQSAPVSYGNMQYSSKKI